MKTNKNLKYKAGFTLIELLVVISIIGLLATIVLVSVNSARKKARDVVRMADLKQIQVALEMYYDANGNYPNRHVHTGSGWDTLAADLVPYLSSLPKDPGTYYYYYDGGESDDYPGYGLMCRFEYSGNFPLVNDGGYYNNTTNGAYYEIGPEPAYDAPGTNWWAD